MRFARAVSVMYESTLPSPCFAKPHFCVQPRKPRQRGSRRAEFREKRDIWDFRDARNIAFFVYYMVIFFIGCHGCGGIFCMGSFPRSYEYGKIRVRLMRTEGGRKRKRGAFRFRRGAAWNCLFLLCNFRAAVGTVCVVCHMHMFVHCGVGRCVRFFRAQ